MKLRFITLLMILIISISCTKKTNLETKLDCTTSFSISNTKVVKDVKKNFKINIPKNWKTELYYDEFQSAVFTADTTKQLSETFILDVTWKLGEIELNDEFKNKVTASTDMSLIDSKFENILEKPTFWYMLKGENKGFEYQVLNIYIKTSVDTYLEINTKIYGETDVNQRLCESVKIINTLEIL